MAIAHRPQHGALRQAVAERAVADEHDPVRKDQHRYALGGRRVERRRGIIRHDERGSALAQKMAPPAQSRRQPAGVLAEQKVEVRPERRVPKDGRDGIGNRLCRCIKPLGRPSDRTRIVPTDHPAHQIVLGNDRVPLLPKAPDNRGAGGAMDLERAVVRDPPDHRKLAQQVGPGAKEQDAVRGVDCGPWCHNRIALSHSPPVRCAIRWHRRYRIEGDTRLCARPAHERAKRGKSAILRRAIERVNERLLDRHNPIRPAPRDELPHGEEHPRDAGPAPKVPVVRRPQKVYPVDVDPADRIPRSDDLTPQLLQRWAVRVVDGVPRRQVLHAVGEQPAMEVCLAGGDGPRPQGIGPGTAHAFEVNVIMQDD